MKLKLLDYCSNPTEFEIGNLEDIVFINIDIVSGDEIAHVVYKDGQTKSYETGGDRLFDFYDDSYVVYDPQSSINLFNEEKWVNRKESYFFLFGDDEE